MFPFLYQKGGSLVTIFSKLFTYSLKLPIYDFFSLIAHLKYKLSRV